MGHEGLGSSAEKVLLEGGSLVPVEEGLGELRIRTFGPA